MSSQKNIYYLTGRGGKLHTGVGQGLIDRGFKVSGREMSGRFDSLTIQEQLDLIKGDLQANFWHTDAKIIAVSYGAYLLLHTLASLESYPGSILLLSPVLGGVINSAEMRFYSPPRSDKLMELAGTEKFSKPREIEIHVGDNDWQSPYQRVIDFSHAVDGKFNVASDTGHDLGKAYVSTILDEWLKLSKIKYES